MKQSIIIKVSKYLLIHSNLTIFNVTLLHEADVIKLVHTRFHIFSLSSPQKYKSCVSLHVDTQFQFSLKIVFHNNSFVLIEV